MNTASCDHLHLSSNNSLPVYNEHRSSGSSLQKWQPRANPPPIKTIELMGLNLHEEKEVDRDVEDLEVTMMRGKMAQHSEETNELFNLMARSIKKRCEERVNLYTVEETI